MLIYVGHYNQGQTQPLFEAFLGAEHPIFEKWLLQSGFAYTQSGGFQSNFIK
jgi:hypothetical protein